MTVYVSFVKPRGVDGSSAGVGAIRIKEAVSIPGSTTNVAQDGETVIVYNGETTAVMIAHGTTPDAASLLATAVSTAGLVVAAAQNSHPLVPGAGGKINIKTLA